MVKSNTRCTLLAIQIRMKLRVLGIFYYTLVPHCSLPMHSDNFHFNFIDIIDIDMFVNCNWVDTRWQYTFTHKQYIEHHN
jgi:hypothetical protein